jgi:hypothetical protein
MPTGGPCRELLCIMKIFENKNESIFTKKKKDNKQDFFDVYRKYGVK